MVGSGFFGAPRFSAQRRQFDYTKWIWRDLGQKSGAPRSRSNHDVRLEKHVGMNHNWHIQQKLPAAILTECLWQRCSGAALMAYFSSGV